MTIEIRKLIQWLEDYELNMINNANMLTTKELINRFIGALTTIEKIIGELRKWNTDE